MKFKAQSAGEKISRLIRHHVNPKQGMSYEILNSICETFCTQLYKGLHHATTIPFECLKHFAMFTIIVLLPGTVTGHFVTIHITPSTIFYIDPYGFPCFNSDVLRFISRLKTHTKWKKRVLFTNVKQIQHEKSVYCGMYAVLYALYFDSVKNQKKLKLCFPKRPSLTNDKRCKQYLNKIIS